MFYNILKPYLIKSELITQIKNQIDQSKSFQIIGLNASAKALILTHINQVTNKSILFVTNNDTITRNIYDDLSLLLNENFIYPVPDYEILPYEEFSPDLSSQIERSNALSAAISNKKGIYIISIKGLLRNINTPENYKKSLLQITKNEEYNFYNLVSKLSSSGYKHTSQVAQKGEFSKRGGILDIFSPQYDKPFRIEFFGDVIDSIREFDIASQCSVRSNIYSIEIQPIREISLDNISNSVDKYFVNKINNNSFYAGIEQDLPNILDKTSNYLDYFSHTKTILILDEFQNSKEIEENLFDEIKEQYEKEINNSKTRILAKPNKLFNKLSNLDLKTYKNIYLNSKNNHIAKISLNLNLKSQMNFNSNLSLLEDEIEKLQKNNYKIFIQSDNKSQSRRMHSMLSSYQNKIRFQVGVFNQGFIFDSAKIAIFTDHEIFDRYKRKRRFARFSKAKAISDYQSLENGDYIIHIDYGIGLCNGLETINIKGTDMDCVVISYDGGDKIFVPTNQLNLLSKFETEEGAIPTLHRIGSPKWYNIKERIRRDVEEIAKDLVYLYAKRKMSKGYSFSTDTEWQKDLEASFIYKDTPDQIKSTEDVKKDMESPLPMERLICGDVGFGKTEVAIRAAFKSVMDSKQVAVLAPTTILVEQHYVTFSERLKDYPINVEMLSRFVSRKKQKRIIESLKYGEVDIIIGTHRLLSKDINFKSLGLVIIDEEQRFGVDHKEKLKKLKTNVDTLILSATPIPRTLNMALSKVKDMSIMNIPPENRLPIRTTIINYDEEIIKLAIRREIDRQGQVFFVHNRIETIHAITARLRKMMPEISFKIGHGQMSERDLESVMLDFYFHKYDVLVCTTIIESGIDIPNVNTMIVNRADKFGLAQLYQLRGRVGRSDHQAYIYLITPKKITNTARERLRTIEQYDALGSGLKIAMKDLEIRGAGNILGKKQHGVMNKIGLSFYNQILEKAIEKIKTGKDKDIFEVERRNTKIHCEIPYFLPKNYIPNNNIRLNLYRRLNKMKTVKEFNKIKNEIRDRFGKFPQPVINVINYYQISHLIEKSVIESIIIEKNRIIIRLPKIKINRMKIKKIIEIIKYKILFRQTEGLCIIVQIPINKIDNFNTNFDVCLKMLKVLLEK